MADDQSPESPVNPEAEQYARDPHWQLVDGTGRVCRCEIDHDHGEDGDEVDVAAREVAQRRDTDSA